MNKTRIVWSAVAVQLLVTLGCGASSLFEPPPTPAPTLTPFVPDLQFLTPQGSPATSSAPTPVTPMSIWPLPADLFYLTQAGQVWRQPLSGDEKAAAPVTPEGETVLDFAVAAGGEWIAYRSAAGITLISSDGLEKRSLVAGVGILSYTGAHTLAWSPDTARFAYATPSGFQIYIPGGADGRLPILFDLASNGVAVTEVNWSADSEWVLAWREDKTASICDGREITALSCLEIGQINGYAWLSDGRLAFAPVEGGLALLNPADLNSRVFVLDQKVQVSLPAQREDGTFVYFVHQGDLNGPATLHSADLQSLQDTPLGGAAIYTQELGWGKGARTLSGLDASGQIHLLDPLTGATGNVPAASSLTAFDWGSTPPEAVSGLPMPSDLFFLAPQAGVIQLWRLPAGGQAAEPVTSTGADIVAYDVSVDGTQVVYTSAGQISLLSRSTGETKLIAAIDPSAQSVTGAPALSPDKTLLAYANSGISLVDLRDGRIRRLVTDKVTASGAQDQMKVYDRPRWSPDGHWLLVTVNFFQGHDTALIPVLGSSSAPILLNVSNSNARWTSDGKIAVTSDGSGFSQPGITIITPGRPPVSNTVYAEPVLDAMVRQDGRIVFLRSPGAMGGPSAARLFSMLPDGTDLRPESKALILNLPALSAGGELVAGLLSLRRDDASGLRGQPAVINLSTGQTFVLEDFFAAFDLRWAK
jgi:hypothetical protein